ncbi:Mo-dependent nitrogenase C-terminal domain-containing protein [Trichocoleus sp. FACHB-90]|uniref:Mo-dependent nitrogenase C-terminal domain-containing protein n=1 Tax=Cyanophyceae TaxID=3028117 RepID=UPI00168910DC|nr:Mo-dependent nitrogenase C-terminal domain-containing protein [Cyanobacteria bacterium FACHB-472]MBD1929100.1 Mo-dependent nitrogenase C-terminal domain-containing protein [Trichocoleus sp. FACHB-90]
MNVSEYTVRNISLASWVSIPQQEVTVNAAPKAKATAKKPFEPLKPLRQWMDNLQVRDAKLAHRLCKMIPSQCPFERDVKLFSKVLFHIPPMCKLNPLYDEVVGLRFRALCYLADECGEDIAAYC